MVKMFNSTICDGVMTGNKKFYGEKTKEEIKQDLLIRRAKLGQKTGFDGTKIIVPYQNPEMYSLGHYEDVTERIDSLLNDNPNCDLWDLDIPCDVMLIRSDLKGVVLAYPVADCPVMVALAGNTLALAHCGAREIDRLLPVNVIDALKDATGVTKEYIEVRFGPSASKDTYVYETYPNWAKNSMWDISIMEKEDGYHIDMKTAIKLQLLESGITHFKFDERDTITDSKLYSNYAANHGNDDKDGRFLVGAFFQPRELKEKKLIKYR